MSLRVLQCVAECCSEVRCVAVRSQVTFLSVVALGGGKNFGGTKKHQNYIAESCSALQRVAAFCSVLQSVAECCSRLFG